MKNLLFNMMVFQSLPRSYGGDWMDDNGQGDRRFRRLQDRPRALQEALRRRRDAQGLAELRISRDQRRLRLRPGGDRAAMERRCRRADRHRPRRRPSPTRSASSPPPAGPEGRFDHIHGLGLGLNKNAKNKDGAIKFLQWLATEDAALDYAKNGGSPALAPDVVAKIARERPDLVTARRVRRRLRLRDERRHLGQRAVGLRAAGQGVHRLLGGPESLEQALANTKAGMEELLK